MNLDDLYLIIKKRQMDISPDSYVASLLKNRDRLIQKIGEESTEVIIAAKNVNKVRQIEELTDLLFHMVVLMTALNLSPDDIYLELEKRKRTRTP